MVITMSLKRITAAVVCGTALAAVLTAPAAAHPTGQLVSVTTVSQLDSGQVADYLTRYGLDTSRVRFGVDAKRIVYRTVDAFEAPTTASALVAVPRNHDRTPRQVTWLHGTNAYRGAAASVADGNDRASAFLFASAGYLTTAPDYLGLGVGPGTHPYADAPSTVTASVDALRATRELTRRDGRRPDPRMFVTGHSQGGHATMALGQAIQRGADPRLGLAGLAPISGPMRPSGFVTDAVAGKIEKGTAYLAYWTVSWNRLYNLYSDPAEAFQDPSIDGLFDGNTPNDQIFPRLPATVQELFTPAYLERVENPTGVLRSALREADSYCDWRPRVPVTVYTSGGDGDVLIDNSIYCQQRLERHHANSTMVDLGAEVDHAEAAKLALPRVLAEFDRT